MNLSKFVLLAPIIAFLVTTKVFGVTQGQLGSIREVANYLKEVCKPADCVVLCIGQSPTPIMAYLENETDQYVWGMPLSNFRYGADSKYPILNYDRVTELFLHFKQYFPKETDLKGRVVLVFDYASGMRGGLSMIAVRNYLRGFWKLRVEKYGYKPVKLGYLALTWDHNMQVGDWPGFGGIENTRKIHPELKSVITLPDDDSLIQALKNEEFDPYSPFGSFDIADKENSSPSSSKRTEYQKLKEEISKLRDSLKDGETTQSESRLKVYGDSITWM